MKNYAWIAIIIVLIIAAGLFLRPPPKSGPTGNFIGTAAPDFTLPSTTGEKISLSQYKDKNNVLLYFQEGVMCPPCWTQMVDFERQISEFDKNNIKILTITTDKLYQSQNYVKGIGTRLPVLADEDRKVSRMYDALKDSMHPGERPGHLFVLVNKNGDVVWRYSAYSSSGGDSMSGHHSSGSGRMYVPVNEVLDAIGRSL